MTMVQTRNSKKPETLGALYICIYIYISYILQKKELSRKQVSFISCTQKDNRNVSNNIIKRNKNKKIKEKKTRMKYVLKENETLKYSSSFLRVKNKAWVNKKLYYIRGKPVKGGVKSKRLYWELYKYIKKTRYEEAIKN